jgi:hypothetical protein
MTRRSNMSIIKLDTGQKVVVGRGVIVVGRQGTRMIRFMEWLLVDSQIRPRP